MNRGLTPITSTTEVFESVQKLIFKIVGCFHRKYPFLRRDDLISEAYFAFVLCLKTFDESLGPISTHVQTSVYYKLLTFKNKSIKVRIREQSNSKIDLRNVPSKQSLWDRLFDGCLSRDAAKVVDMVITVSHETRNKKYFRKKLRDSGFTEGKTEDSLSEIEFAIQ